MAGWHHQLDGHEFEWTPGDGNGQGGLACCDSWGCKESDMNERLNWTELDIGNKIVTYLYINVNGSQKLKFSEKDNKCKRPRTEWFHLLKIKTRQNLAVYPFGICFVTIKVNIGNDEHKDKMMVMTAGAAGACTVGKYKRIQRSLDCSFLNYIVANTIMSSLFSKLYQFSSVTQLRPTLCNPMDYRMPLFPVHHQLPELAKTHVHWVSDAI